MQQVCQLTRFDQVTHRTQHIDLLFHLQCNTCSLATFIWKTTWFVQKHGRDLGFTRVGVTRAETDGVDLFSWKTYDFLVIALCKVFKSDDLFSCRLVTTPTFRRRLSSFFLNYAHNFFHSGVIPGWCHPWRSAPHLLVTPLPERCVKWKAQILL